LALFGEGLQRTVVHSSLATEPFCHGVPFMVQGKRFLKDPKSVQRRARPGAAIGPKKAEPQKKRSKLTSVKNQIRAVKRLLAKVSVRLHSRLTG
jgi:hypothetical protein